MRPFCFKFCASPCAKLNGDVLYECGACSSPSFACRPGSPGFPPERSKRGGTPPNGSRRSRDSPSIVEWRPTSFNALCVFTAAVGDAAGLLASVEHNANWAVAHSSSFTLFRSRMARAGVDRQWEKVLAARHMLQREQCEWLLHVDADAVVVDVSRSADALRRRLEADAAPATPVVIATCNSPLGHGHSCDVFCCVRAREGEGCCAPPRRRPAQCAVGLHDVGLPRLSSSAPYPCMLNSGVWFMKNAPEAHTLVREWEAKQAEHAEIFGEQASLNELKERHPGWIDIVGAQVMNTPSAFHRRMLRAGEAGRAAFDYALRTTSGYEPAVGEKNPAAFERRGTPMARWLHAV